MTVLAKSRVVYFSSAANRHFMTKQAACRAEASRIIRRKYPTELHDHYTGAGFHWTDDERLLAVHARLVRLIERALSDNPKGDGNGR